MNSNEKRNDESVELKEWHKPELSIINAMDETQAGGMNTSDTPSNNKSGS